MDAELRFNCEGPLGLVDAVVDTLSASVYPAGLAGAIAADCRPESRELVIELEFPRQGVVRLGIEPTMDWDGYVHLAFAEIRLAGADSLQVTRRLRAALTDLTDVTLPDRMAVLDEQLELLVSAVEHRVDRRDLGLELHSDRQGLGVAAGRPPPEGQCTSPDTKQRSV